jgi:hypothetical protein
MATIDWTATALAVGAAKGIAFDGCHKIYVLMDDAQVEEMRDLEYDHVVTGLTPTQYLKQVQVWYDQSCGLRFVNGIKSPGRNEDFTDLVPQGADWDEDEEDY